MSLHISLLISAFHHFLQMIEPLTWSEHQTLAKPSTFPLRNHYLLLSGGKKTIGLCVLSVSCRKYMRAF